MASHDAQPFVSTDNPDHLDALQRALDGMRDRQQQPGLEPDQRDVPIAPLPPYDYEALLGGRPTPGTPLPKPARIVRDPERVTVPEMPAPVSHSPTRPPRTRPFLPVRSAPEYVPVSIVHEVQTDPPTRASRPAPTTIRPHTPATIQPSKNSPKNWDENSPWGEILDEFSGKGELTPTGGGAAKPTTPLSPKFTTKLFDKPTERKKRGRQRAKDRHSAADGVRQLFELWWLKANGRVPFGQFYRNHLSKDMRSYYTREYIYGRNAKSHAEYRKWRAAWDANHASASA